ncbi:MAG: hypothetical protein AB1714_11910 [Acidobacteriota bacterium]
MKEMAFVLTLTISVAGSLSAGAYWLKQYGTAEEEAIATVVQTSNGGYLCGGTWCDWKSDGENNHAWITRLKPDGAIASQRRYGSKLWSAGVSAALETPDGGTMVIGGAAGKFKTSVYGRSNALVMRLDKNGKIKWQKIFQVSGWDAVINSGRLTADGGCVVAGFLIQEPDGEKNVGWVFKVDSLGKMQWQKQFDYGQLTLITYPEETNDGQFLCSGGIFISQTSTTMDIDALLVLLGADGSLVWQKRIGTKNLIDLFVSARPLDDGGYVACGLYSSDLQKKGDQWLARFDAAGTLLWQKAFGNNKLWDLCVFAAPTSDGGFVVSGGYSTGAERFDGSLARLDASGNLLWRRSVKAAVSTTAWTVWETTDGGFVSPLTVDAEEGADYDPIVLRTDKSGNLDSSCSSLISTAKGSIRNAAGKLATSNVKVSNTKATTLNGDLKPYSANGIMTTMCESYETEEMTSVEVEGTGDP